jgi:hypothetical protein
MNKEQLEKTVNESNSITEVCFKMYGNKHYGNRITIKKYIAENNINVSHFKRKYSSNNGNLPKKPISEILVCGSTYNTTHLKNRLYKEGLKERKCELCGQDENWYGNKLSLILDHINGINNDHRFENLRIVCPNCDATLPTFSGKNIKSALKKKHYIKKSIDEKKSSDLQRSKTQRKVKRPEFDVLQNEVNELGYSATGRKYGVSDNAIRKWLKIYNTSL